MEDEQTNRYHYDGEELNYIHDELQEIAMDHVRVSNRIYSLKIYIQRLKDNKKFGNDILEFDDPVLEDIAHG
jgi:hypothetical protein